MKMIIDKYIKISYLKDWLEKNFISVYISYLVYIGEGCYI